MSRRTEDTGKLVLRLMAGGLLLMHGLGKIQNNSFVESEVLDAGLPAWVAYGVFIGEVVAPVLLLLGLFTRIAAVLVAVDMLFALALVHYPTDFSTVTPGGAWGVELPMLFLLAAVGIALVGPGHYALRWNPDRDLVVAESEKRAARQRVAREVPPTPITYRP